jgi:hypothetical protein
MRTHLPGSNLSASSPLDLPTRSNAGHRPRLAPTELFTASVRVPVLKQNREYLRALRAAELVAWEKARCKPPVAGAAPASARKAPSARSDGSGWETCAFGLLGASAAFVLSYGLWVGARCAAAW